MARSTASTGAGTPAAGVAAAAAGALAGAAAGAAATTGAAGATKVTSPPALRIRTFKPSRSISNSVSSCSRTRSRICLMSSRFILDSDDQELAWGVGQHLAPLCRHQHIVFQSHAAETLDVRAGLDGAD